MEKLLNENTWDNATTCEKVEGPCELIRRDEILKALRMMKKGKAGKRNVYRIAKQMPKSKQLALQELCRKCLWLTKIVV